MPRHLLARGAFVLTLIVSAAPGWSDEDIFQQLGHDALYIGTSPTRVTSSDTSWFLGSAALMGGAFASDRTVHLELKPNVDNKSSVDLKNYGNYAQMFGPLAGLGFWTAGYFHSDSYTADTGRMAVSSLLWTFVVNTGLKFVTGRARPSSTQDDPFLFTPFRKSTSGFVSAHTSNAFAAATVFAERYPTWKVAVPVYTAATAVAASRLFADAHWTSDVIGGAMLGFGMSHAIVSRRSGKAASNSQITFNGRELQWVLKF